MTLKKMYNAVIIGMICLLIITLVLLASFSSLINRSRNLNQDGIRLITHSNDMLKANDYLIKLMRVFVVSGDMSLLDEYNELLSYNNLEGKLDAMIEIGLTQEELLEINGLYPLLDALMLIEAKAIDAYRRGDIETARSVIFSDQYSNADFMLANKTSDLISDITQRVHTGVVDIQNRLNRMKIAISVFITLSISCFIALQIIQRNRVLKPIVEIEGIMQSISRGYTGHRLVKKHNDEIGSLFDHVNDMASSIGAYMEEANDSQRVMKSMLDGIDASIYVTIPDTGEILFINEHMKEHFGIEGDARGQYCYKILQSDMDERCEFCPCFELDENPDKVVVWEEHNTVTGRIYQNMDRYIDWLGGVKVHLQHSVDITDIKKFAEDKLKAEREALEMKHEKEKAEASARAKNDFLAKMSHEIRTPMNAVMGMSELILRKDLPQDVYENAMLIKSSSLNLLSIINDILDFSKIESGMMEIIDAEYHLPSLINDVIGIIRIRLIDKPVQFAVNIDPRVPSVLIGDEIRIRQVITNLLSNAVKYTHEGHISLGLSCVMNEKDVTLIIDISDTGIGVKEENLNKLFGDFVQFDAAKNKGIEGTGLGLAISRNLCRMMDGDISVRSEYGAGSTFTMTLLQRFEEYIPFAFVTNPKDKSVLLYETREVYKDSLTAALDGLGVECKSAKSIPELFENMEKYPFVFISSFLYGSVSPMLSSLKSPPTIALLADITETSAPRNVRLLSLPAHSLSVANVLEDADEDTGEAHSAGSSFTAPQAKVLIVDDVVANLKVCEGLMLPYEMQVTLCGGGREAIELISHEEFDLVFMDHMMPQMDGIEATAHIRAMDGEYYKSLPIVALTANAVSGMREMFIQNGMNDFLAKPIETAKLDAVLEKWIPKDKRSRAKASHPPEDESEFFTKLREVPELSVDKALALLGGSPGTYERIIKLSARLLPENIASLDLLIDTCLPSYSIAVHGIKGVLNNLGAYALGGKAAELEDLSKHGDIDACNAIHPGFISELTAFSDLMQSLIDDDGAPQRPAGDPGLILEALPELEEAIDFGDNPSALRLISPLGKYSYGDKIDGLITSLTNAFERFDFDEAVELFEQLKGVC